ncbi:MAG: glycosyl hydrolase family 28-related protein [Bryobacteraceae bacterium]
MNKLFFFIAMAAAGYGQKPRLVEGVSVKDFGAMGDGVTDDTAAIQNGMTAACFSEGNSHLHFPAGTYNINTSLTTGCAMIITGDGPLASILFMTAHRSANHGIIANYPLEIEDIAVNTAPVMADLGMVAVFRQDTFTPSAGQNYTFLRYYSSGFNFGIDVAGVGSGPDQLGAVVVRDCILATSTSSSGTAVSEPLNVRTAASLTAENNLLLGDGNGDHGIYVIGIRTLLLANNTIQGNHDSSVKVLTGGFGTGSGTVCDAGQDYQSWTVRDNIIQNSDFAGAFYTYCDTRVPVITYTGNRVLNMTDTYLPDGATLIFEPSCSSMMSSIVMGGNVFQDITQGGVLIQSSAQFPLGPCPSSGLLGTVSNFVSTGDQFINWSTLSSGTYFAISANGPAANLLQASVLQLTANGQKNGRAALNLGAFAQVSAVDITQINIF